MARRLSTCASAQTLRVFDASGNIISESAVNPPHLAQSSVISVQLVDGSSRYLARNPVCPSYGRVLTEPPESSVFPKYLQLDNRYYRMDGPQVFSPSNNTFLGTFVSNCRRANGSALPSSPQAPVLNLNLDYAITVTGQFEFFFSAVADVIRVKSLLGDIQCDGEVPDPDFIFKTGME